MTVQTANVLQKLFSENSLDNIPLERLKQITEDYPYFTLGQLLLAKKLQSINAEEYEKQSEKASIYFSEPMWLQTLLHPPTESDVAIGERSFREERTEAPSAELPAYDQHTDEPPVYDQHAVEPPVNDQPTVETSAQPEEPENPVEIVSITSEVEETEIKPVITEQEEKDQTEESPVIFEPYHTIDYFASQGIRISNEIKPEDRLGQQLRSFTQWLKTMKRLPETKVEEQLDSVAQQNIQEFASHSLVEKEVVTETMAEVLVKQHKEDEAVVIYEKLSLLNPSKRAYFAAKIEQLKGQ